MEQPTRDMISYQLQQFLDGGTTRENVSEWARAMIRNDDLIRITDIDAWHYLVAVSNIDERIAPDTYLYDEKDIREIMAHY